MIHLSGTPLLQALGWTLVHSLWQGAGLGLLALAGLRLTRHRSAASRYLLACAALTAAPVLSLATLVISWPQPIPDGAVLVTDGIRTSLGWRDAVGPFLPYAAAFWMLGVGVMGLRLLGGWYWVQRLRWKGAGPAPEAWTDRLRALADRMGVRGAVGLLASWTADAPMVIGWIRPVILVPAAALTGMAPAALEAILAHELAHIRRHDYLVNLLQSMVEALFFYHPAIWWISRQIRAERENCCDDAAVSLCGDRLFYARALAGLEDLRHSLEPRPGLAVAANGGVLMNRIRRLILPNLPPSSAGRAGLVAVLAVTALGAAGLGLRQEPPAQPAPEAPKAEPAPRVAHKVVHVEKRSELDAKAKELEAKAEAFARRFEGSRKGAKPDPELDRLQKEMQDKARELAAAARKLVHVEVRIPRIEVDGKEITVPELEGLGLPGDGTVDVQGAPGERRIIVKRIHAGEGEPAEAGEPGTRRIIIRHAGQGGDPEVEALKAEVERLRARLDALDPKGAAPAPPAPPAPLAPPAPPARK